MAWWLAYEELNGTMDETYPIKKRDNMNKDDVTILGGESVKLEDVDDIIITGLSSATQAADTVNIGTVFGSASPDTLNFNLSGSHLPGGMGSDHIDFSGYVDTMSPVQDDIDDVYKFHYPGTEDWEKVEKPQPDLTRDCTQKYGEDKGIKDLKDYVSSTYSGHYTSQNNNVQTLDLIQSVGDAESFCRSNAIKYLSRYDKKGQAKRDILKAMHYCLLLYYFSGQTNETPTRGYETF
jgi:hypothetical protein